ncbi:MAG: BON domain-containing protein [Candidatus Eremiobacteraeota bacterium]|nr:BON domain-containing protein [Candidatus Eremiobacteraeota bacterium]
MRIALSLMILFAGALLTLMAMTGGCAPPPQPPSSIQPLDTSHVTALKSALNTDPELASAGIQVTVQNDTATLTGTVNSEEAKKRAEAIALKTRGINKVVNNLQVAPSE